MRPRIGFHSAIKVMRNANYRNYTIGSTCSLIGTWTQRVATGWLTWQLTGSGAWLGIIAATDLAVMVAASPFAGVMADRFDRLKLSALAQFLLMVQAIVLTMLYFAGVVTIEVLLALTAVLGMCHAFHTASRLALVPNLVPREDLAPAIAINSIIFNVARFLGPAVAGIVIANGGVGPAFAINAFSFAIFLVILLRLKVETRDKMEPSGDGIFSEMMEGFRYAASHPGIGPMLMFVFVTAFASRSISDLLPGFVDAVFNRGPAGLAWMTSAMGFGAMLAGIWLLAREGVRGLTKLVTTSSLVIVASLWAFTATTIFWLAIPCLVVTGFGMIISGVGTMTLIQSSVEGKMRGRVMSLFTLIHQGGPALGALTMGILSESIGLRLPVAGAGFLCLLAWLWITQRVHVVTPALETVKAD